MAKNMKLFYNKTKRTMEKQMEKHKVSNEQQEQYQEKLNYFFERQNELSKKIKENTKRLKKRNISEEERQSILDENEVILRDSKDLIKEIEEFKKEYQEDLKKFGRTIIYLKNLGVTTFPTDKTDAKSFRKFVIKLIGTKYLSLIPLIVAGEKVLCFYASSFYSRKDEFFDDDNEDKDYDAKEFSLINGETKDRGIKGPSILVKDYDDNLEPIFFTQTEADIIEKQLIENGAFFLYDKERMKDYEQGAKLAQIEEGKKWSDKEVQDYINGEMVLEKIKSGELSLEDLKNLEFNEDGSPKLE